MLTILQDVPNLVNEYIRWLANPDLGSVRKCRCGHPERHRHGSYWRWVVLPDGLAWRLRLLRLKCPQCRKTESIQPDFLRPGHQYPWQTQQALIEQYAGTHESYRRVAEYQAGLPYQRLWQWVHAMCMEIADLARSLVTEITRWAPGSAILTEALADGRAESIPAPKARSVAKRKALGWMRPLLRQARRLWQVGDEHVAGWGRPDPGLLFKLAETFRRITGVSNPT